LTLVGIAVLAVIINALAPRFGGRQDSISAFKLAVYGATASLLGGVFLTLPALSMLGIIAGLYSIYLLYVGLPVLMKNPPEKTLIYIVVIFVVSIVINLIIGALSAALAPRSIGGFGSFGGNEAVSIETP